MVLNLTEIGRSARRSASSRIGLSRSDGIKFHEVQSVDAPVGCTTPDRLPTRWKIEQHTIVKHAILKAYLDAWFPILGGRYLKLVYLDGFAGPGAYEEGQIGSPVIAIESALRHKLGPKRKAELVFFFIESRHDRVTSLREVLKEKFSREILASHRIRYSVHEAEFAPQIASVLDKIEADGALLAPTLAFLDPFGFSGMPMRLISRILKYRSCEVLATFMEGFVNRFASELSREALDELFGDSEWTPGLEIANPIERREFWLDLYQKKMKQIGGARHVLRFEMVNKFNQTEYYLVFGTSHWRGVEAMKEAMFRAAKTGDYQFSDRTDPAQKTLIDYSDEPTWAPQVRENIWRHFEGSTVSEEEIHKFVVLETRGVYRIRMLLHPLRADGRILSPDKGGFEGKSIQFARRA
jgi:three-Cys-motif partner protein